MNAKHTMRRQPLTVLVRALQAARGQGDLSAQAAPALRQYSSLISLQNCSNQQWQHSNHHFGQRQCLPQGILMPEGHRLFSSGPDMTPEPFVSPGLPAVPVALDEDTVASMVPGDIT